MPLTPGTRLGPYEVIAPLGAGGMGEVYRARDPRLGRDVAVKVLPPGLAGNPESRARFEREARTISALNHPHICVLHDVGREGDVDFLVMELIEGETLTERIARGPLPTAEVLRIGGQIADALDRAHRAGVIHRDLKPGNVMLTRAGAKLMDFGLARATGMAGPASDSGVTAAVLSQSPTSARPLTAEGTIVGTFQYMSPEQLEGHVIDARSDLWALGCVLYEMATGRRAFEGKSQASLIGAIMHAQPPPASQLAPASPPALDRLIAACLVKDPAERVQSAHDVKLQLAWMAEGVSPASGVVAGAPAASAAPSRPGWIPWAVAAVALVAIVATVMALWPEWAPVKPGATAAQRYVLGKALLQPQSAPMLSPDGTYVVFSVREEASRRIYRRNLSSFDMTPIAGTEEGQAPFFSPDGAWIGFTTPDALKKVPAAGGVAQTVVSEPGIDSADWGPDGTIWFSLRSGGRDGLTALARVPDTGGAFQVAATLDTTEAELEAWLPEVLPDGKTVLLTLRGGSPGFRIVAIRPDGSRQAVVENGLLGRYVRSGHLVYFDFDSEAVLAAPFDPGQVRVTGPAVPLTEVVDASFCFDVADDGKLVYVPARGAVEGDELVWLDRKGAANPVTSMRSTWTQPRISPDGRKILVRKIGTNCELWMFDVPRNSMARIVHGTDNHDPVWSPDGRRIAFERAATTGPGEMVTLTVEGAREERVVARGPDHGAPQCWSESRNLLAYTVSGRGTRSDIWVRVMDGVSPPEGFLTTEANEYEPTISPDGRWIAYTSNETGTPEVFVRPYPDTGTAWQISVGGGGSPLWSRDGRELYFVAGTKMMAVPVDTRSGLRAGDPVELFDGGFSTARSREFDIGPDGRFVAVGRARGQSAEQEIRMLLDWPAETGRVGAGH